MPTPAKAAALAAVVEPLRAAKLRAPLTPTTQRFVFGLVVVAALLGVLAGGAVLKIDDDVRLGLAAIVGSTLVPAFNAVVRHFFPSRSDAPAEPPAHD